MAVNHSILLRSHSHHEDHVTFSSGNKSNDHHTTTSDVDSNYGTDGTSHADALYPDNANPERHRADTMMSVRSHHSRTATLLSVLSFFTRDQSSTVVLRRKLGLSDTLSLLIGVMIGTGIFVSPPGVLSYSGSYGTSIIVWFLCGVLAMIGSLVFTELALMFPKSGGDHTYLHETYGDVLGFLHGWAAVLVMRPMSLAIASIVIGEYIVYPYFRGLCHRDETAVRLHAATFIIFMMLIQGSGLKLISRFQNIISVVKVATLLIIIANGMVLIGQGHTEYLDVTVSFDESSHKPFEYAMAFYQGMFAYEGWNSLSYTMEEVKEPAKTLPRAIYIAVPTVTLLYVLTNISYYTILTPQQVGETDTIAVTFSRLTSGHLQQVLPFLICCSAVGTANGLCYTYSRMAVSLGREGHMPQVIGMVSPNTLSPNFALFLMGCISISLLLIPVNLEDLVEFFSFAVWLSYFFISVAVLILRVRKPDMHRPFRVNLLLPMVLCVSSAFFILAPFVESHWHDIAIATVVIVSGLLVYIPFLHWKYRPPFMDKVTIFCQLFFNIVPTEYQPPADYPSSEESNRSGPDNTDDCREELGNETIGITITSS